MPRIIYQIKNKIRDTLYAAVYNVQPKLHNLFTRTISSWYQNIQIEFNRHELVGVKFRMLTDITCSEQRNLLTLLQSCPAC